ncbi:hypothetical protein PR202_gb00825 [Eleusine coracana subsp. coracana]|uniref:Uncharacterized protein n=1 Tax=Eleusine coracana subsp. coracana TaxID=191504 RepID=A0AAV5DVV0_ELECO|nr:hypothetical protein PR202_gb00825 [Eleusine coracana subsp. coracana]
MAYRRKPHPMADSSPSFERHRFDPPSPGPASPPPQDSLAAQAMRASAAHRDASSLASAYSSSAAAAARRSHHEPSVSAPSPDSSGYEYTSMKSLNEAKYGFWGALARKAKSFLDEDGSGSPGQHESPMRHDPSRDGASVGVQSEVQFTLAEFGICVYVPSLRLRNPRCSQQPPGETWKSETPPSQKRSEAISSSLNYIGGTIKSALEVANAMAAKAKLLLRELKTVKADLAFAKDRCAQLEEENKMLRESYDKGDNPEDDDLIRLQLETLLAEKARLAHENSVYARENRFLREIVEYHQLTMQDVIYVDEGIEEVTEVYPTQVLPRTGSNLGCTPATPKSASSSPASASIVVPEACPNVPASPKSVSRASSLSNRASPPPPTIAEE